LEIFQGAPGRDLHTALNIQYVYDIRITKLRRLQAEVVQNHENEHVRSMGKGEARNRKYKKRKLSSGQGYYRSND
jgi:hypothetical protein